MVRYPKNDSILLWEYLGLEEPFSHSQADNAYKKVKRKSKEVSLAWKILRDEHFCREYKRHRSTRRVFESGFFDDGLKQDTLKRIDYLWPGTPIGKIENNLKSIKDGNRCAVLLMTGAFAPIHRGHMLCLENAKNALEERGIKVIGGYISPSHDNYVKEKINSSADTNACYRIELARLAVNESDWLMIDPWESLDVSAPVNYTFVYDRLKKYLSYHFSEIKLLNVFFVVGSDNAYYIRAFIDTGYCVCVERFNYKKLYKQMIEESGNSKKIIYVEYNEDHLKCSSSCVRGGDLDMLDSKIKAVYKPYVSSL